LPGAASPTHASDAGRASCPDILHPYTYADHASRALLYTCLLSPPGSPGMRRSLLCWHAALASPLCRLCYAVQPPASS
jgi:hypothetical protein